MPLWALEFTTPVLPRRFWLIDWTGYSRSMPAISQGFRLLFSTRIDVDLYASDLFLTPAPFALCYRNAHRSEGAHARARSFEHPRRLCPIQSRSRGRARLAAGA